MAKLYVVSLSDAEKIILVLDNLNIHSPASLYTACEAKEAKRIVDKLEVHPTPKHGSWLNIAEIELAVLAGQCLDRRLPDTGSGRPAPGAECPAWRTASKSLKGPPPASDTPPPGRLWSG